MTFTIFFYRLVARLKAYLHIIRFVMFSFFITCIACVVLVLFFYVTLSPISTKHLSVEQLYTQYVKGSGNTSILAFTRDYNKVTKLYENYYINDDGELELLYETRPVDKTGELIKSSDNNGHGIVTSINNGFRISGINMDFTCPDNWLWSEDAQMCEVKPICDENDTNGTIKGITMNYNVNTKENKPYYHPKRYAICNGPEMNIGTCKENSVYNQMSTNPPNVNPCEKYDVCENKPNGFTHRFIIDDHILGINEYYMCLDKKSKLVECQNDTMYSTVYQTCVEIGRCVGKPNGYTFYIDDTSYAVCNNDTEQIVNCQMQVFYEDDRNISCSSAECFNLGAGFRLIETMTLDHFSYFVTKQICKQNKVITESIKDSIIIKETTYTWPVKVDSEYYAVGGSENPIPTITWPSMSYDELTGNVSVYKSIEDIPLSLCTKRTEVGRYNLCLPEMDIDIYTNDLIINTDYKWQRSIQRGLYVNNEDPEKTVEFKDVLSFYYGNVLYKPLDPVFVHFSPTDGHYIWMILREKKTETDPMDAEVEKFMLLGAPWYCQIIGMPFNLPDEIGTVSAWKVRVPDSVKNMNIADEKIVLEDPLSQTKFIRRHEDYSPFPALSESDFDFKQYKYYIITNIYLYGATFTDAPILYYVSLIQNGYYENDSVLYSFDHLFDKIE